MPDPIPTQPTAPTTAQPQEGQTPAGGAHHSQRQPRDDGKRFAGPPAPETQPQDAQPPARFKRTVKRNGKEEQEEASLEDLWSARDRLAAISHKERASTERFQRASQLVKEHADAKEVAEALMAEDFSKLERYFVKHGKKPVDVLAKVLDDALHAAEMTPEQRELAQLRADKAAREEEDRRRAEDAEVAAFQAEVDKLRPQVQAVWSHALEKTSLPKTEKMMEVAARIFLEAAEAGTTLSPEQVAELTHWELVEVNGGLVNELDPAQFLKNYAPMVRKLDEGLSPEDFEKHMPGLAKRYHRHLVAKLKGSAPQRGGQKTAQKEQPKQQGEKVKVYDSFTGFGFGS